MLLAGMQDASKGIVAKEEMVYLCGDRFAWRIKEVNLFIILYRNICEFMQINLDVDTTWKEKSFYVA